MEVSHDPVQMIKSVLNYFGFTICEQQDLTMYGFMTTDQNHADVFLPIGPLSELQYNINGRLDSMIESIAQKCHLAAEIVYHMDEVFGIPTWVYSVGWIKVDDVSSEDLEPMAGACHTNRAVAMLYSLENLVQALKESGAVKKDGKPSLSLI